jgi:hypothetical protein
VCRAGGLNVSVLGNRAVLRMKGRSSDYVCQCGILKLRRRMARVSAIRDYLSGWKSRMHSFEAMWWNSHSRFKHCAMASER